MKVCSTQAAAHAAVDKSIMWSLQSLIAMQWLGKSRYQSIMAEILEKTKGVSKYFSRFHSKPEHLAIALCGKLDATVHWYYRL